jgi:uncharacterized protein YegL
LETTTEVFPIFPVFLLIDVSASMAGDAMDAVNAALPDLKKEIEADPTVGEIARIGVVTFSDQGRTLVPLSDLAEVDMPEVMVEGGTNFAAGFDEVKRAIDTGLHSMPKGTPFYRPVVFFMSDGMHQARQDWKQARADLLNWKLAPEIVTFGLGEAAPEMLQQITTKYAFMSKDVKPADQVREIMRALLGSIVTTSRSFSDPGKADGLVIEAPSEHFTPLPRMTL